MTYKKYIEIVTKVLLLYNKSFHGLQILNLNIQELVIHFIIALSPLFNISIKPNKYYFPN